MGWNRELIGLGFGLCFTYFTFQQFLCIKDPNHTLPAFLTPCRKEECAYLEVKRMDYRIGRNRVITLVLNTCWLPSSHQHTDVCFFCESHSIRKLGVVWGIKCFQILQLLEYLIFSRVFSYCTSRHLNNFQQFLSWLLQVVSQICILSSSYLAVCTSNLNKHFVSSTS